MKKKMKVKKRRPITLIEIIIVIALIGMIMGVIAYNYTGGLEKGKVFKTEIAIDKIETILNYAISEDPNLSNNIQDNWQEIINNSPLIKSPESFHTDGWGGEYTVTVDDTGEVKVTSPALDQYKARQEQQ